jgi:MerR family transcriptional regulator, thiopeptide resistance regulator
MSTIGFKVGDLAKQTGVSVRTLHYYDEIGLLSPSQRTESGYRLYGEADIIRLQQIVSLRQIGFSLDQIRSCLEQEQFSPQHIIQLHLSQLQEQMALQQQLHHKLSAIATRLQAAGAVSIEEFIQLIEVTIMIDKYYTPDQQDYLAARGEQIGVERIRESEAEWQELIAKARSEMEKGTDPFHESVQELARRWRSLVAEFTGGDPGIQQSLNTMYQQEGAEAASRGAMDTAVMEYMGRAMQGIDR